MNASTNAANATNHDHYARMPTSVRIGCHMFKIEVGDSAQHEEARTFGHVNFTSQKISLRPGMSSQNLANVFLHEVLHALHWWMGAGYDWKTETKNDYEEMFTYWGANALCAFWQDNPDAIQWLNSLLALPQR
jgi:hypothetical protein